MSDAPLSISISPRGHKDSMPSPRGDAKEIARRQPAVKVENILRTVEDAESVVLRNHLITAEKLAEQKKADDDEIIKLAEEEAALTGLIGSFVGGMSLVSAVGFTDSDLASLIKERDRLREFVERLQEQKKRREEQLANMVAGRESRSNLTSGISSTVGEDKLALSFRELKSPKAMREERVKQLNVDVDIVEADLTRMNLEFPILDSELASLQEKRDEENSIIKESSQVLGEVSAEVTELRQIQAGLEADKDQMKRILHKAEYSELKQRAALGEIGNALGSLEGEIERTNREMWGPLPLETPIPLVGLLSPKGKGAAVKKFYDGFLVDEKTSVKKKSISWKTKIELVKQLLAKQAETRKDDALAAMKARVDFLTKLSPAVTVRNGASPSSKVRCILLYSSTTTNIQQRSNTSKLRQILNEQCLVFEEVDGAALENEAWRDYMFSIIGDRGSYPQVFFVEDRVHAYLGGLEKVQELVDANSVSQEFLRLNPAYPTFERVFFEWAQIALTGKGERKRSEIATKRIRELELDYSRLLKTLLAHHHREQSYFDAEVSRLRGEISKYVGLEDERSSLEAQHVQFDSTVGAYDRVMMKAFSADFEALEAELNELRQREEKSIQAQILRQREILALLPADFIRSLPETVSNASEIIPLDVFAKVVTDLKAWFATRLTAIDVATAVAGTKLTIEQAHVATLTKNLERVDKSMLSKEAALRDVQLKIVALQAENEELLLQSGWFDDKAIFTPTSIPTPTPFVSRVQVAGAAAGKDSMAGDWKNYASDHLDRVKLQLASYAK